MRRVTVRDVAAAAGVSQATASRVLSGGAAVSPALSARVRRASDELGFSPNMTARALRTSRTDMIGMLVPAINNPYFVMLIEAVEGALAGSDRSLIVCDSRDDPQAEAHRVQMLLGRMVDGLIVVPVDRTDSRSTLTTAGHQLPVVQVDRTVPGAGLDFCGIDNLDGMRQICAHLAQGGHRTVAFIGARPITSTAEERLTAFRRQASAHGLTVIGERLGTFTEQWGREAGDDLLASGPCPDAIVCGADVIAYGLLRVCQAREMRVGEDLAVVGFDDLAYDEMTSPPLSSVRHPTADIAEAAVAMIDARASGMSRSPTRQLLAPTLVVRDSSRPRKDMR